MTRPASPEAHEPGAEPPDYQALPYPARMRAWALSARGLPEPGYRRVHAGLADRHLALHLAVARRDLRAVERALADPDLRRRALAASIRLPVGDDPLVAVLWSGSAADRRALYGVLRRSGRVALAERLLARVRADFGDPEALVLLAACSPSTVERWLPGLGAQLGDLHRLARVAPAAVAGLLEPDPGARWSIRAWARYGGLLSVLARRDPDAAALATIRSGRGYVGGPDLTRALLAHPGDHELWLGAARLPRASRRILRALPPAEAAAVLVRCGSPADRATVLAALPPDRRAQVLRLANPGGLTMDHAPELAELPDVDRVPIVRQLVARDEGWQRNATLTTLLPWAEAAPYLWSATETPSWKTRAAAWDRLLRRALREPDPRIFATVAAGAGRAWHDQNAVRITALRVLAGAPRRHLAAVPRDVFRQVTEAVLHARDSTAATVEIALRCLARTHEETALIARLLLAERAPARLAITIPAAGLWAAARERILREAAAGHTQTALRIAGIAPPVPELDALVGQWARAGNEDAAAVWIAAPATREARVGELVAADRALGASPAVWRIVATRRTDLAGAVLAAGGDLPPVRPAVLARWTAPQRAAYRARAERVALDEDAPLSARIAAAQLVTSPAVLTALAGSAPQPVAAAALTAYGHSPDAVPLLLHRAGEPAGVVSGAAVRALPAALGSLPPWRITEVLAGVLRSPADQVGAAKEAARLLGSLRPPGAFDALFSAWHGHLHHDVRAAVAVVTAGFADPRAGTVLAQAAVGEPAVRSAVASIRPDSLAVALRPAVGRALAAALRSSDEDVRRTAAIAYRRWWQAAPEGLSALPGLTGCREWGPAVAVLAAAAGSPEGARAVRATAPRPLSPVRLRTLAEAVTMTYFGGAPDPNRVAAAAGIADACLRAGLLSTAAELRLWIALVPLTVPQGQQPAPDLGAWDTVVRLVGERPGPFHAVLSRTRYRRRDLNPERSAQVIDHLLTMPGSVAGLLATDLLADLAPQRDLDWDERIRRLLGHPDPDVREAARARLLDPD